MRTWLSGVLVSALLLSCAALASCAAPAPAPTAAPAAQAPAAKAPSGPTSAPAAAPAAPAVVKTVVVEKVVEVAKAAAQAPTVVVTTPTPAGRPISAVDGATDWDRILTSGRLVVGMSSGYRPFAYYNESSELDGFDVAVVREIALRLGLTGVTRDTAADTLMGALRTRQIDLALPGPSGPPAGEAPVDFTKPYHVCRDVILAAEGATAGEVRAPADLTAQRVGVLRSSRHEAWLQRTLLDTGQMEPTGLFTFTLVSQMMNALQAGQIDLAILDNVQAQPLLTRGGVRLVGQDLNKQNRTLAVPKGFDRLREEVDSALAEMVRDGTLTRLSGQYLGLEQNDLAPLPTSTPEMRATPAPSPSPTARPPTGSFTANPIHIAPGDCTLFTWNVEDVREVYFYPRGQDWEDWPATGQETRQLCPAGTVTYELRVVDADGVTERRSITILVDQRAPLPLSSRLTTDPATAIEIGSCIKLSWEVRGNPIRVQIMRDLIVLWTNAPEAGSMEDCPPEPGTVVYGVMASAPGHTTQTQRVITVNP